MLRGIYQNANGGLRKQNGHYQQGGSYTEPPVFSVCFEHSGSFNAGSSQASLYANVVATTLTGLRPGSKYKLTINTFLGDPQHPQQIGLPNLPAPYGVYIQARNFLMYLMGSNTPYNLDYPYNQNYIEPIKTSGYFIGDYANITNVTSRTPPAGVPNPIPSAGARWVRTKSVSNNDGVARCGLACAKIPFNGANKEKQITFYLPYDGSTTFNLYFSFPTAIGSPDLDTNITDDFHYCVGIWLKELSHIDEIQGQDIDFYTEGNYRELFT